MLTRARLNLETLGALPIKPKRISLAGQWGKSGRAGRRKQNDSSANFVQQAENSLHQCLGPSFFPREPTLLISGYIVMNLTNQGSAASATHSRPSISKVEGAKTNTPSKSNIYKRLSIVNTLQPSTRALYWVSMSMPMPTHIHGFWVGMGAISLFMGGHGWTWVRYYHSWVGIGFVHPCIQLQIGVKLIGCKEYANQEALRAEASDSEQPFICPIQPRLGVGM